MKEIRTVKFVVTTLVAAALVITLAVLGAFIALNWVGDPIAILQGLLLIGLAVAGVVLAFAAAHPASGTVWGSIVAGILAIAAILVVAWWKPWEGFQMGDFWLSLTAFGCLVGIFVTLVGYYLFNRTSTTTSS